MPDDRRFLWDQGKALANKRKHGVTFEEASDAFNDVNAVLEFDSAHSGAEDRFVLLALSARLRVLFIVHADIGDNVTRIISARRATRQEHTRYEQRRT
ncbi:MAG TPA: BrnT family toxin [Phycisphaerales bacterium]|nr:BrnT family toxin [Phycisphaerales bacterium]